MAGLSAAVLAREGFRGAAEAFEGKAGFLRAYAPNPVPERALQDLGTAWELMNTAVKPYPSCRYGHACVDAAIALHNELGLKAEEIESVTMGLPNKGMLLVGAPLAYKQNPQNVVDGQFSGPFVVACGLVHGHMGWDSYAHLQDPAVRSVLPKVTCLEDPEIQALFPDYMSGKLTLRARGQEHVRLVRIAKGEPENFLTEAELRAKFHGLVDAVLGRERAAQLADAVVGLDRAADVNGMLRLGAPMMAARLAGNSIPHKAAARLRGPRSALQPPRPRSAFRGSAAGGHQPTCPRAARGRRGSPAPRRNCGRRWRSGHRPPGPPPSASP
jgi:2-methylcitrate dehydratase PrpD